MKRILICLCLFLSASLAHAEDGIFNSVWPFNKTKETATPAFDNINPFVGSKSTPASDGKLFSMPSFPKSKSSGKTSRKSESMFAKTRETWSGGVKGVQDFGKNLNPFAGKNKTAAKKKSTKKKSPSFLARLFSKKEPAGPATVGEFLSMKRP